MALKELRNLRPSELHLKSINYAAKLVHTRRTLSSSIIGSHQPVSGQACNPPNLH
jgi:hypothetical protein